MSEEATDKGVGISFSWERLYMARKRLCVCDFVRTEYRFVVCKILLNYGKVASLVVKTNKGRKEIGYAFVNLLEQSMNLLCVRFL